jgi:hypothetical protein
VSPGSRAAAEEIAAFYRSKPHLVDSIKDGTFANRITVEDILALSQVQTGAALLTPQ